MGALFVCTGDLHLGQRPDLADDRLAEQSEVWRKILSHARRIEADAVLFAGDAFEGPLTTPEQIEAFIRPIEDNDVRVIAITGNGRHDSAMREVTALEPLRHVPHLEIAKTLQVFSVNDVRVVALPWTRPTLSAEETARLVEHVASDAHRSLHPSHIGVLLTHFSMSGARLPNGLPVDQLHEPIVEYGELEAQGWKAIVCGHIHEPQTLGTRGFYVGSPMPLNFGEAGSQHGFWTLEVSDGPTRFDFQTVESRPLITVDVPVGGRVQQEIVQGGVFRISYTLNEHQDFDQAGLRDELLKAGAHRVFFKPTIVRAERARVESITESLTDEEALAAYLGADDEHADLVDELLPLHRDYVGRIQ